MDNISVIVPVYNSKEYLQKFFSCFDQIKYEKGDEVIIVDNGSTDGSFEICRKKQEERPDLYRVLKYDETASSYAARNFGVCNSRGKILAFTDSDCCPVVDWLMSIRKNIDFGNVLAGKIVLDIKTQSNVWEQFDVIAHLQSEENCSNNRVATANMAVFKSDFEKIGQFEERFSGGDYVWSQEAARNGLVMKFVPEMLIHHPTRKTYKAIQTKQRRIAYGEGDSIKKKGKSVIRILFIYILRIFKFDTNIRYAKLLKGNGIGVVDMIKFICQFEQLRIEQLRFAIKGYKGEDVRKKGIK